MIASFARWRARRCARSARRWREIAQAAWRDPRVSQVSFTYAQQRAERAARLSRRWARRANLRGAA